MKHRLLAGAWCALFLLGFAAAQLPQPGGGVGQAEGGEAIWGSITGTLADQTDLNDALSGKQASDAELTAIAGLTSAASTQTPAIYLDYEAENPAVETRHTAVGHWLFSGLSAASHTIKLQSSDGGTSVDREFQTNRRLTCMTM